MRRPPKKQNVEPSSVSKSNRHIPPSDLNDILHHRTTNSRTGSSANRDEPPSKHLRETLHKYGVEMKEPKIPQSRKYSSSHDSDEENHATPRRLSQPKHKDSASRTKNTLEHLLNDDTASPAFDYLGHLNGGSNSKRKQSKDNINVSRQSNATGYTPSVSGAKGNYSEEEIAF